MNLLAIDSGTEHLSIAVSRGESVWQYAGAGGARASTDLIAGVLDLLGQAGLAMGELDAMAFGAGPGSFTGLRTACSVVQGLAFGANVPVLPMDSLLAVAEQARQAAAHDAGAVQILALLDARMDEVYAAHYAYSHGRWRVLQASVLVRPEALVLPALNLADGPLLFAGNIFSVYADRIPESFLKGGTVVPALPTATAMLRLAPAALTAGQAVDAAHAMPSYVRDKVAKTTAERMAEKAAP